MQKSIEDIIKAAENIIEATKQTYSISFDERQQEMVQGFLQRILPEYPQDHLRFECDKKGVYKPTQPLLWYLADMVLLFAYLARFHPIDDRNNNHHQTFLDSEDKLPLLRQRGYASYKWSDLRLYGVCSRRESAAKAHKFTSYKSTIDKIGQDPMIVSIWGNPIQYHKDIDKNSR